MVGVLVLAFQVPLKFKAPIALVMEETVFNMVAP
jgi:hypothetical protein